MQDEQYVNDVAIIGLQCRFPGAPDVGAFWRNLHEGVESIRQSSDEELEAAGVTAGVRQDPRFVNAAALLPDVDMFDARFFGLTPVEAQVMDPQHRLFLECAWAALENAGYDPGTYPGSIAVCAGVGPPNYMYRHVQSDQELTARVGGMQVAIGNSADSLATLVSYKLGLGGPSFTVQTACSTSLVAVHLACQSLLSSECDMALAGGVSISCPQQRGYLYQDGGILSRDGHCRAFDSNASGTVFGSGVGIVVLKRLADAVGDRDSIHAIIRGSAINNDGAEKGGFTAPSVGGHAKVVTEALTVARTWAESIGYVEAHGTGTLVGDPIEVEGLTQAFREQTEKRGFCAIGSVKTNIGHLDRAAGVASLIKAVLALKHKTIPPSLHFVTPNPKIDFDGSPFYVNTAPTDWWSDGVPRRAGVSSLGIGGTNAHVVLEEAPSVASVRRGDTERLLLISAKTEDALEGATDNLAAYLNAPEEMSLGDVAFTLQAGRRHFRHRRVVVAGSTSEAAGILRDCDAERILTAHSQLQNANVAFLFPGQGAQYVGMARDLYREHSVFREEVDSCCECVKSRVGFDLRDVLYPVGEPPEGASDKLNQTQAAQLALFVVEYGLAKLWQSWGIAPTGMLGHSIGEYVAACLAGVFSVDDALGLVAERGRLMQQLEKGAMLAAPLPVDELEPLLGNGLSIASINGPKMCVASGPVHAVSELASRLKERGVDGRRLETSHAFHSSMMLPMLEPFRDAVSRVPMRAPRIPYISNVTGTWIRDGEATDPRYWIRHIREPVRFGDGLETLLSKGSQVLLEVGPGQTLYTLTCQHPRFGREHMAVPSMRHPKQRREDHHFILTALGRLWLAGVPVDWSGLYRDEEVHRVPLPTYPFQRKRFWVERREPAAVPSADGSAAQDRLDPAQWYYVPAWTTYVRPTAKNAGASDGGQTWLVFAEEDGLGWTLAERLREQEQAVIRVVPGEGFAEVGDGVFTVNPRSADDYGALISGLVGQERLPQQIVHCWMLGHMDQHASAEKRFEACQYKGLYSLIYLAQALEGQEVQKRIPVRLVASGLHAVAKGDSLEPEKATVLGVCRVIAQEFPFLSCFTVDIGSPDRSGPVRAEALDQLLAEILERPEDAAVALRGKHRAVLTYRRLAMSADQQPVRRKLKDGGVYLITGGLGRIGMALAEYLASNPKVKLALVGRSAIPARGEWERWERTNGADDVVSQKIRSVRKLEGLGAEVVVVSADVAELAQMQRALGEVVDRFGRIDGVIHAAGVLDQQAFCPVRELGSDECWRQLRPKVDGLYVLEEVLRDRRLDFCLLTSSLSAILGGLGYAAYASANAFMDAFAQRQSQLGQLEWRSVNWDSWQLDEGEEAGGPRSGNELTRYAMAKREGVETLGRLLTLGEIPQVVVSTGDLQRRIDRWVNRELPTTSHATRPATTGDRTRPMPPKAAMASHNAVERAVLETWQDLLGIDDVGMDDNFFELGGSSLSAIQLMSQLKARLGVDVPVVTLYDAPTARLLATSIAGIRGDNGDAIAVDVERRVEMRREGLQRRRAAVRTDATLKG